MDRKSESRAKTYRNKGNDHYRNQEHFEALLLYNRSLCVAEKGSESISIAFANRSAVYLKLNQFELCLENIQLARDNNYPQEKVERLNKREEECKELMKTKKPNPNDDPFNFFKLSYPANSKYPQIVDCLEWKNKHVLATRDLKTGDILAVEEPSYTGANPSARLYRCNCCLRDQLLSLIPCSGCAMAMFCSKKCQQKAMKGLHQFECSHPEAFNFSEDFNFRLMVKCLSLFDYDVEKLKNFINASKSVSVFDLDFSDPDDPMYEKKMFLVMLSGNSGLKKACRIGWNIGKELKIAAEPFPKLKKIMKIHASFLIKLVRKIVDDCYPNLSFAYFSKNINSKGYYPNEDFVSELSENWGGIAKDCFGETVYPFLNSLKQSCDPNVKYMDVLGKSVVYVCKPIKKGSEIFMSFAGSFSQIGPAKKRREMYKKIYDFWCNCEACVKNWPTVSKLPAEDPFFKYGSVNTFAPHEQAKQIVASNNAFVDRNFKEHVPSREVYVTIHNNFYELCGLTRPSFYP